MNDIDHFIKVVSDYAMENELSPFDKILPEEPISLSRKSKRIIYKTKAATTKFISLKKKNKYHYIIFKSCVAAFQSAWFNGINDQSKPTYFDCVRGFFDWINETDHSTTDQTRYAVLKAFEAYVMNDRGCKSSPLGVLNNVIGKGMECTTLSDSDYGFLQKLLPLSIPVRNPEPELTTLSSWFDLPWLRSVMGEKEYLQLESPRLLFHSFRVTIATTLLFLLRQRQQWQQSLVVNFDFSYKMWQHNWNPIIMARDGKFNKRGQPEDEFSSLLLLDLVKPSGQEVVNIRLAQDGSHNLKRTYWYQQKHHYPWQLPVLFHPKYQAQYSHVEELMCAWLAACQAIQPSDIPKLKTNNYTLERNTSGRLIAMECIYYKGRSGTKKKPSILMGKDSWTQAMDQYMAGLSAQPLFPNGVVTEHTFPTLRLHSVGSFLLKLWKLPSFRQRLELELQQAEATPLFLHAMLALELGDESASQFSARTGKSRDEYRLLTSKLLPAKLFTLTHIKNTAVHAGSDSYRSSDLINHHSHTSLTEKISYLTDQNKEWVNQAGRITRLVINDLQNVVFQPSIESIIKSVNDLELRTQISQATHTNDIVTYLMHGKPIQSESDSTILVLDTNATAIFFIHYITQAEALLPKLLEVRPDFVERTLIVKIEWMTRTLTRMQTAAAAKKIYKNLAGHLAPLFDHLLDTME